MGIYTLIETVKANSLDAMKYIKYILPDMLGSTFLQNPAYLDDYLPWEPMVQESVDNHCPFSIEVWWLFFCVLSCLMLTLYVRKYVRGFKKHMLINFDKENDGFIKVECI